MAMNHLSKHQWKNQIAELAQKLPSDLPSDDPTLMQILVDIIVAEQARLKEKNLGYLVTIAAVLLHRTVKSMPKATHRTAEGNAAYSLEQIAAHLGCRLEDVQQAHEELQLPTVDPATLRRVN